MRILFLSHYFPPEVNAPAARTYEHCVRWARAGHEVTVVTCAPNCPDGVLFSGYRNRLRPQVEMVDGIRVVRVWTYLAPNAGTVRRIANYVSYMLSSLLACLFLRRPDVVVATSPQFFCGWAGVLVSRLKRRPLVLEIRDIWPESIRAVGALRNGLLLRVLEKLEKWMYRAARHIVAVGNGYRDEICKKADVAERVTVITNGVDLELFHPEGNGQGNGDGKPVSFSLLNLRPRPSALRPPPSALRPPSSDLRPPTSDLRPPTTVPLLLHRHDRHGARLGGGGACRPAAEGPGAGRHRLCDRRRRRPA